jgi:hypothetical protein
VKPLHLMFADFNARYWNGRLPKYRVRRRYLVGIHARWLSKERLILIDRTLDPYDVPRILLHEMCHVRVGAGHGRRFLGELKRIAELGEPLAAEEFRLMSDKEERPRPYPKPTYRAVQRAIAEVLTKPDLTDVIRGGWRLWRPFLAECHFGLSARYFDRYCPWARNTYYQMLGEEVEKRGGVDGPSDGKSTERRMR